MTLLTLPPATLQQVYDRPITASPQGERTERRVTAALLVASVFAFALLVIA